MSWKIFGRTSCVVYEIEWCDPNNPTAAPVVSLLADLTTVGDFLDAMAYLEATDELLVFVPFVGWYAVDRLSGSYYKFYPPSTDVLNYESYGALVVNR